jgi:chromosome segregation protein
MLKRLELVGFKSFADKTTFDFAEGITAVIGPNGSGKSNLSDAIRWVLGEQSAKSLRGGEMTDVIFNGSASRKSLGLAEVTMTLDNTRRRLATEADEVQVTRRVYRSGEGEYLLNGVPCRLKDVKDLFLGSGAGADAYCIIEQGRVDVLLQASAKDRRTIFEEAAGISRFKAKKAETLRRLERVDANLQRLRDILDEVEKQLRSVKLQASKAQRFQEYSARLRELRVALGLAEYHQLHQRLAAESSALDAVRSALDEQSARAESWERELLRLEEELTRLDALLREQEGELASARQQIATEESTLAHEWSAAGELENDLSQTRLRLAEWARQVATLAESCARAGDELRQAEAQCQAQAQSAEALEAEVQSAEAELVRLHREVERTQEDHLEAMRQAARLHNDTVSFKAQLDNLSREQARLRLRSEQAEEDLASLDLELEELSAADGQLQERLGAARDHLAGLRAERDRLVEVRDATAARVADLKAQRSGVASRVEVLEGLQRSHEGLGTGPREVFAHLEGPDPGPWRTVLGILAEVLTVRREFAPLIDLALGERAQRFLVRDPAELLEALRSRGQPFSGRVSFLPVAPPAPSPPAPRPAPGTHLTGAGPAPPGPAVLPGVVAFAEQVVRCDDPRFADLPARLLGNTLIFRDLTAARAVRNLHRNFRCITLRGELLEADGTLTVGTHHAEAGILSRRSELRELREQSAGIDRRLAELGTDLDDLRARIAGLEGQAEQARRALDVLNEQATDMRWRISQHRERRAGLSEEVLVSRTEISGLAQEIERLHSAWQTARDESARAEARVGAELARKEEVEGQIRALQARQAQLQQDSLSARVALAQVEERLSGLRARQEQIEGDLRQRDAERQRGLRQLAGLRARLEENSRALLNASAALASAYVSKETSEAELARGTLERASLAQQRQALAEQAQEGRSSWRARQEEAHARELAVNDLRHHLDSLCARLRDDYQLDLAEVYEQRRAEGDLESLAGAPAAGPAEEEIAELRRKLSKLGGVNLEAIDELAELEARHGALRMQFDDLTAAHRSLEEIITKINGDSRRLFTETFAAIRGHFQELFRKLFGGGMADVVLEEGADVLEAGVEVVARPPGKELRNISLMSGGEKTLTAVALLMAIFRSRPSPFCVLDEVDAALDEANVGRFTATLREFLDSSQFILITHHKRTMACADVLYGVTMQESGVSRRFAVRFEDWPDEEPKAA